MVSRKEGIAGAVVLASVVLGGFVWSRGRLRAETLQRGAARLVAVGTVGAPSGVPEEFGSGPSYGGRGDAVLYARLPGSAQNLSGGSPFGPAFGRQAVARVILPDGGEGPLGVDVGHRVPSAAIAIPRDYPPGTDHVDVELKVPGEEPTRWRVENLPATVYAFDPKKPRTEAGSGSALVRGRALFTRDPKTGRSFVLAGFVAPDFLPAPDEACDAQVQVLPAFVSPAARDRIWAGVGQAIWGGNVGIGYAHSTPYAARTGMVCLRGTLTRRRVFDEWADFGTVPLRPRDKPYASMRSLREVGIDLSKPRVATTPSGLRLTLGPDVPYENSSYDFGKQTLVFRAAADPKTLRLGLPPSFTPSDARIEVGIDQKVQSGAIFSDVGAKGPIVWALPVERPGRSTRLRVRVRRSVVVEAVPFDLRLPVDPKPVATEAWLPEFGESSYSPDPVTMLPKPYHPPKATGSD